MNTLCYLKNEFNKCLIINALYEAEKYKQIIDSELVIPYELFTEVIIPFVDSLSTLSTLNLVCHRFHIPVQKILNQVKNLSESMNPYLEKIALKLKDQSNSYGEWFFLHPTGRIGPQPAELIEGNGISFFLRYVYVRALYISWQPFTDKVYKPYPPLQNHYLKKIRVVNDDEGCYERYFQSDLFKHERIILLIKEVFLERMPQALTQTQQLTLNLILIKVNEIATTHFHNHLHSTLKLHYHYALSIPPEPHCYRLAEFRDYLQPESSRNFYIRRFDKSPTPVKNPFHEISFNTEDDFIQYLKDGNYDANLLALEDKQ